MIQKILGYFLYGSLLTILSCNDGENGHEEIVTAQALIYTITAESDSSYIQNSVEVGAVTFEQVKGIVTATFTLSGLTPYHRHAIHIHTGNCQLPGQHWNQGSEENFCRKTSEGEIWARPKAGDVGNVRTDGNGNGTLVVSSEFWSLNSLDEKDIVGRAVIIHENMEDFPQECFQVHNDVHNNPKIACGTIEITLND